MTTTELPPDVSGSELEGVFDLNTLPDYGSVEDIALSSGWEELDEIFRFYPGQFTLVTGFPGSGKSTFMFNLLAKLARDQGIGSILYAPENQRYLQRKMRQIWRNDETFEYQCAPLFNVLSAEPEHHRDNPPKTLQWVLDKSLNIVKIKKAEILIVDPWNELERAKKPSDTLTDYIAACLMDLKAFARYTSTSVVMVAHPTKDAAKDDRMPRLSDVEGSMAWYNKCDNGLVVHRKGDTDTTLVQSQKVREEGAGKLATCYFTVEKQIFTPQYGAVFEGEEKKNVGAINSVSYRDRKELRKENTGNRGYHLGD